MWSNITCTHRCDNYCSLSCTWPLQLAPSLLTLSPPLLTPSPLPSSSPLPSPPHPLSPPLLTHSPLPSSPPLPSLPSQVHLEREKVTWPKAMIQKMGEGMPNYESNQIKGNLYITVDVDFPRGVFTESDREGKSVHVPSGGRMYRTGSKYTPLLCTTFMYTLVIRYDQGICTTRQSYL